MRWLEQPSLSFQLRYDAIATAGTVVVAVIALVVAVYAIGYLRREHPPEYGRFFCSYSAFVLAMLGFGASNSLLLSYVCWEAMTACSYVLISFRKSSDDARAGTRSFIITRVGDLVLLLGVALIWQRHASLNIEVIAHSGQHDVGALALIVVGALAKSAALPFSPWLVGAMKAPTPVSALLHSATLVAAGPYLLLRLDPAIARAPQISTALVIVAFLTAFVAAVLAIASADAKRLLAYSTIEQLAQATLAAALNVPFAGLLFLAAHAAAKPLLFFAAGEMQVATGSTEFGSASRAAREVPSMISATAYGTLMLIGAPPSLSLWSGWRLWNAVPLASRFSLGLEALLALLLGLYLARFAALLFPRQMRPFERAHIGRMLPAASFLGIFGGLVGMALFYRWPFAENAVILPGFALLGGALAWWWSAQRSPVFLSPLPAGLPDIRTYDRLFANPVLALASAVNRLDTAIQMVQERIAIAVYRLGFAVGAIDARSEFKGSAIVVDSVRRAARQLGALINGDVSRYAAYCAIGVTAAAVGAAVLFVFIGGAPR